MFTLTEALQAIANKPEFSHNQRDGFSVIDYHVSFADTFIGSTARETSILQNLRGACFAPDGTLSRLPLHKFHNYGETAGYMPADIDFSQPHHVLLKLDGSMVAPIWLPDGTYRLGTRAGVTDVSMLAEKFVASLPSVQQQQFSAMMLHFRSRAITPVYELCSRLNRVVLDYPVTKLVLLSARYLSGEYLTRVETEQIATQFNWEIVPIVVHRETSLSALSKQIKDWKGTEGVVVAFDNGFRVKIKSDEYCLQHKALDSLRFEKDVLRLVLQNSLDDVLPLVMDDVKERLLTYRDSVQHRLEIARQEMMEVFDRHRNLPSKKEFAEMLKNSPYKTGLFKLWDGKEYSLVDYVLTKCNTQPQVEEVRWLIGKSYYDI